MVDKAHVDTDKMIVALERKLKTIYSRAGRELKETAEKELESFSKADKKKKKLVESGKLSEKKYREWRKDQLLRGKHFENLQEQVSKNIIHANETAISYINDALPPVYALNYNASGKDIKSQVKGYSFELTNPDLIRNLSSKDDKLLPMRKKLDIPKDKLWNQKKLRAELLQAVIQGDGVDKIAKRMRTVSDMNAVSSMRNARTMVTGAENKARYDQMKRAEDNGIIIKKEWMAVSDSRTRDWHAELDGQRVNVDEAFENSIGKIRFPGDPAADGANVYNCRCTMASVVVGFRKDKNGR